MLAITASSTHAESINEIAFKASLKATCSVNKDMYKKCFHLNEDQCINIFTELIPKCSGNKYLFPLKKSEIPEYTECLIIKFEEKLVSKGINLDESCSN